MDTVDDKLDANATERPAHADLAQLMAAARANTAGAMERLLESAQTGELPAQLPTGTGYLLFVCAGRECAVPLSALREVLAAVPRAVYLPFTPVWMLGIFPLRNEMLGLVDPVPVLTYREPASTAAGTSASPVIPEGSPLRRSSDGVPGRAPATALIVGSEDRCLAWAVDSVGDIALVQDGELCELGDLDERIPRDLPFERRYVKGVYTPRATDSRILVLDAETLLTDQLDALEQGSEGHDA
jgi:chemotaxis signal transduction protein